MRGYIKPMIVDRFQARLTERLYEMLRIPEPQRNTTNQTNKFAGNRTCTWSLGVMRDELIDKVDGCIIHNRKRVGLGHIKINWAPKTETTTNPCNVRITNIDIRLRGDDLSSYADLIGLVNEGEE